VMFGTTAEASSASSSFHRVEAKQKIEEFKLRRASSTSTSTSDKICSVLISRIDKRIEHMEATYERHASVYALRREKLVEMEVKLQGRGEAASLMNTSIARLDVKIAALAEAKEKVLAALTRVRESSCGDNDDDFRASIQALRDAQKSVGFAAKDIHTFVSISLRQDIAAIRDGLQD
jgi:hypothetical protein